MKLSRRDILTIPNLLSMIRIMLIPLFMWMYMHGHTVWTAALLLLSGATDIVDGYIARRFNQISDVGKVLDPLADKLTQAIMLLCLTTRVPVMRLTLKLLIAKECLTAVSGIIVILRTGNVLGAQWHGKATTMLLYGMMILHVVWKEIPLWMSNALNAGCAAMMLLSMVLYVRRNLSVVRFASAKGKSE